MKCFFLILCLALSCSAAQAQQTEEVTGQIVAEINSRKISAEEIEEIIQAELPSQFRTISESAKHNLRKQVLSRIIEHELLETAARNTGYAEQEINELISHYLEDEVFIRDQINEAEIQAYYYKNQKQFSSPTQVRVRHIFIAIPSEASEEEIIKLKSKAAEIQQAAIKEQKEFFELAKAYSQGPRRANGGDLGFITANQLKNEFSDLVFSMEVGTVTSVLEDNEGLHIFKVEDKKVGNTKTLEHARDEIREKLRQLKRKQLLAAHVEELKQKNKIIIYID